MQSDFLSALPPLPLPAEMRAWDAEAVKMGIPEIVLMENAAKAAFDVLCDYVPNIAGQSVWLFMGGGNNGADAACLARYLLDSGAHPLVLHVKPLNAYKGAGARHIRMARGTGVEFAPLKRHIWQSASGVPPNIFVDGLLGTGFTNALSPEMQKNIAQINSLALSRFVLALDIPSGLDAVTGRPAPIAVKASATVSFAAAKPGLVFPSARQWTGRLHVRPIGIPAKIRAHCPCSARLLLGESCLKFLPALPQESYKNSFGHVLVIGGAQGYSGAAHLAARAALRTGAGLVTVAAPAGNVAAIKCGFPEIMTLPLDSPNGDHWPATLPKKLCDLIAHCSALVVGPGMGRSDDAAHFLSALMKTPYRLPTVFDADALTFFSTRRDLLEYVTGNDILTPHPGEAAALLACDARAVQDDRQAALTNLCALHAGVVLLKGAGTLVGQIDKPCLISPYDVPQLATGGSGDVLSGCLGALLSVAAHKQSSLAVAGMGAVLHALAGQNCAKTWQRRGNTASEIADALPHVSVHSMQHATDRTGIF